MKYPPSVYLWTFRWHSISRSVDPNYLERFQDACTKVRNTTRVVLHKVHHCQINHATHKYPPKRIRLPLPANTHQGDWLFYPVPSVKSTENVEPCSPECRSFSKPRSDQSRRDVIHHLRCTAIRLNCEPHSEYEDPASPLAYTPIELIKGWIAPKHRSKIVSYCVYLLHNYLPRCVELLHCCL